MLIVASALVVVRYHYWRAVETLPQPEASWMVWFVYTFWALEAFCAYRGLKSLHVLIDSSDRVPEADSQLRWYGEREHAPLIDLLIPTYNEGRTILRLTIVAASRQIYPRFRVWVLDDGQRPWLSELCSELRVHYLGRKDRTHFKAGNLNHALRHICALPEPPSHVAVLDADFVAYPTFLQRTMALMKDPRVGLVQTPQCFYNPDPFQYAFHAHSAWPEDWRANAVELAALDAKGLAGCYGTSFLVRVAALRDVRGFPTESLLEDALLSMKLDAFGWRAIYLNERLSVGSSPEGLAELQGQRARWYRGQMQMFVADWRSFGRAVALRWRAHLLGHFFGWFGDPALRLAWLLVPVIYWFTGIAIVRASTRDALLYCLPALAPHLVTFWLSRGAMMPIGSQVEKLTLAPLRILTGIRSLLDSRQAPFHVTPKGIERRQTVIHWRTLSWMLLAAMAISAGVVYRVCVAWPDPAAERFLVWNAATTALMLVILGVAMVPCIEQPRYRKTERYAHHGSVPFRQHDTEGVCDLLDLSVCGARIALPVVSPVGSEIRLTLTERLHVDARVVRRAGQTEAGLELRPTLEQEAQLIELVLCSNDYVPQPEAWPWWGFCAAVLSRAGRGKSTAQS